MSLSFVRTQWNWLSQFSWRTFRQCSLSLADQTLVSGSRFLTTALIGSLCGADELGVYALGFSIVVVGLGIQLSLINGPYTVFGNRLLGRERDRFAGSVLVHVMIFALVVAVALFLMAILMSFSRSMNSMVPFVLTLSFAVPLILLREFARQLAFAHLNVKGAFKLDLAATAIHVVGLIVLAATATLSALTAFAVIGAACGVSACGSLFACRRAFVISRTSVIPDFWKNWQLGRWSCASEGTMVLQTEGLYWFLAMALDLKTVGIYVACLTVMKLANPFFNGMVSVLAPKTVQAYAAEGSAGAWRIAKKTSFLLGSAMALFGIFATVYGEAFVRVCYRGSDFVIRPDVVTLLALYLLVGALATGAQNALWAMARQDINFRVGLLGLTVAVIVAAAAVPTLNILGAALAMLTAKSAVLVAQWWTYSQIHEAELRDESRVAQSQAVV